MVGVLKALKEFVTYYRVIGAYREPKLTEANRSYLRSLSPDSESALDSVLGDSLSRKVLDGSLSPEFVRWALYAMEARRSLIRREKSYQNRN